MGQQHDSKKRLDLMLVELGLAPSRTKAQDLIRLGQTTVDGKVMVQPSHLVDGTMEIELLNPDAVLQYVSRGGYKLAHALRHCQLDVRGFTALDLGLSTGGFADCLFQRGAHQVIGIDVGHFQVDPRLMERHGSRLTALEGVHVRSLGDHAEFLKAKTRDFDVITVDLSFISLLKVLPDIVRWMVGKTHLLALVKPQFELGQEALNRQGVVLDSSQYQRLEEKFRRELPGFGLEVKGYFPSELTGKDGNQEFFVHCRLSEDKK